MHFFCFTLTYQALPLPLYLYIYISTRSSLLLLPPSYYHHLVSCYTVISLLSSPVYSYSYPSVPHLYIPSFIPINKSAFPVTCLHYPPHFLPVFGKGWMVTWGLDGGRKNWLRQNEKISKELMA